MPADHPHLSAYWRALLVLGRTSNLPTVWSNCLAGWMLGGGEETGRLWLLLVGATFLYLGGMFLNDAYDAEFDRQHRPERPIPRGAITLEETWEWGLGWLVAGMVPLILLGQNSALLATALLLAIVVYDVVHKILAFSPILMAVCRFLLYLLAASAGSAGVTGMAIWGGLALAAYVVGLSYLARRESTRGVLQYWPLLLLSAPLVLTLLVNAGEYRGRAWMAGAVFTLWVIHCLRGNLATSARNIGRAVSGLLAGIALVDLMAVAPVAPGMGVLFALFFLAALALQRHIPAT